MTAHTLGVIDGTMNIKHPYVRFRQMGYVMGEWAQYCEGIRDAQKSIEWARCMKALELPTPIESDPVQPDLNFGG